MTLPNDDTPKPDDEPIDVDAVDVTENEIEPELEPEIEPELDVEDVEEVDVEYADAEILPPIKTDSKKGLGFKSLLTATVFAGLLGAGGGFGLSYYLLPKLTPTQDMSGVETRIATLAEDHQDVSTQINRLEQSVRDVSRQAEAAGLTDMDGVDMSNIATRFQALEQALETQVMEADKGSDLSERFSTVERRIEALTAFDDGSSEPVPVEIARRLEALETQTSEILKSESDMSEAALNAVDPASFMYGDRLLRDILQEILENQIALQSAFETASDADQGNNAASSEPMKPADAEGSETDTDAANTASTWRDDGSTPKSTSSEKTSDKTASSSKSVIGSMTSDTDTDVGAGASNTEVKSAGSVKSQAVVRSDGTLDTGTLGYIKSRTDIADTGTVDMGTTESNTINVSPNTQTVTQAVTQNVRPTIVLPEFPEAALRTAIRDHELSGKSWFARVVGKNLSIKKPGERDIIDEIVDLIEQKDISGALDKMETLPSSVRSVGRDWMRAARQVR